jgi:hypothetical protein
MRAVGVASRPGRPKTAIQRVSRRPDAASVTGRKEAKRVLGLGVGAIFPQHIVASLLVLGFLRAALFEGYGGHLTVATRKHDPVRSSHGHRSQCDSSCTDTSSVRATFLSEPCRRATFLSEPRRRATGLSEPCERSQCEAACGRMDNNLTLAALAELLLRYRPRLDGSLRPVPPNHFRCKPFHSIATEPLILSCRPSLECSCATFLSEPCERLVWHRDQVDRRPQFNEFRGGQMRPRPRAAEKPSVCSAWVSGQFSPSTSSLRSSYWAFFGPPSSRATEVISP